MALTGAVIPSEPTRSTATPSPTDSSGADAPPRRNSPGVRVSGGSATTGNVPEATPGPASPGSATVWVRNRASAAAAATAAAAPASA
ncbi:hypothetical protein [Streptosporangium vulgare]|uniref:hypothetical protein n=1 Tax=Streptosporangium vulgare TaxID=46190 RepID=UPI0031D327CA